MYLQAAGERARVVEMKKSVYRHSRRDESAPIQDFGDATHLALRFRSSVLAYDQNEQQANNNNNNLDAAEQFLDDNNDNNKLECTRTEQDHDKLQVGDVSSNQCALARPQLPPSPHTRAQSSEGKRRARVGVTRRPRTANDAGVAHSGKGAKKESGGDYQQRRNILLGTTSRPEMDRKAKEVLTNISEVQARMNYMLFAKRTAHE
jgi:hypothetical protein